MRKTAAAVALLLTLSAVAAGQRPRAVGKNSTRARSGAADTTRAGAGEEERVLDRALLAQGGLALALVKTRITRGRVTLSDSAVPGTFEAYEKGLDRAIVVVNMPGGQLLAAHDGGRTWLQTPLGTKTGIASGTEGMLAKAADGKGGFKWRNAFSSLSLKGRAAVDGHETVVLAARLRGGPALTIYFDVETGLVRKQEYPKPAGVNEEEHLKAVVFDSYATVDGVKVPVLIRQVYAKYTLTYRVTEVRHNVPIMDAFFESPNGK